jgi:hypothetical protein
MAKAFDLFLSHNMADAPWTERLAAAIEGDRSGPPLGVFFDKWDIPPGGDIPAELEEALQASRYVGLVLSPESLSSDWVALEWSTAIHRDPRARQRGLIPLLRRTCKLPDILARLKHIDFRREQDFSDGVETLVEILRGHARPRGANLDPADVHFREDAALLRQHRRVFDRAGFRVACILELSLPELLEAIDDTAAAIHTGTLYSRSGKLLSSFPDQNEYRLPEFREAFSRITRKLTYLKQKVTECSEFFLGDTPSYSQRIASTFLRMVTYTAKVYPPNVRVLVGFMDVIDEVRNEILEDLNVLLFRSGEATFNRIELTSQILKKGEIGPRGIAPLLE